MAEIQTNEAGQQMVEIASLNPMQLQQLQEQLKSELELFSNSMQQLRIATSKFQESLQSVAKLDGTEDGHDVMVPMTSSLYVAGKLKDTDCLLIDVGTGYFVEKNREEAIEYFQRKIEFIGKQMETIQGYLKQKVLAKQKVDETLQAKVAQLQQQQKAAVEGAKWAKSAEQPVLDSLSLDTKFNRN